MRLTFFSFQHRNIKKLYLKYLAASGFWEWKETQIFLFFLFFFWTAINSKCMYKPYFSLTWRSHHNRKVSQTKTSYVLSRYGNIIYYYILSKTQSNVNFIRIFAFKCITFFSSIENSVITSLFWFSVTSLLTRCSSLEIYKYHTSQI